jgi:FkbM family methyltransferase
MQSRLQRLLGVIQELGLVTGVSFIISKKLKTDKIIKISNLKHPIFLRRNSSDTSVFSQIFVDKEYDIELNFEPKVIIDGGANIGLATVYFKNRYPNSKIIAVEPDAENMNVLKSNVANYKDVFIKQVCLWPQKGQMHLNDKYGLGKWAMVVEEFIENGNQDLDVVEALTLTDIMNEFNLDYIDLLKLDIESAEKQLFSDNYMQWLTKTKVIIIELHDWMTDGCSKPFFSAINKAFKNYSYSQFGEHTIIINRDLQ